MERIVLLLAALSGAAGFDVAVDKQAVLAATTVLTAEHDSSIDDVALSACAPIAEPGAILDPEMVTRARRRSRNSKTLDDDPAFMAAKQSVASAISAVS